MSKTDPHVELLKLRERYGIDLAHAEHVAGLCDVIFTQTAHLHGLPKTFRPVVRATGLFHDIAEAGGKDGHDVRGGRRLARISLRSVTPAQKNLMAQAVLLHSRRSDVPGFLAKLARRGRPVEMEIVGRIAAILRIADGLDHARKQDTRIAAITDDGKAVDILVEPARKAAGNAAFAMGKADLWNSIALRPIRAIRVARVAPKPARLLRPALPTAQAGQRLLCRQFEYFMARLFGLAYDRDTEFVHELRVADRRFRLAAQTFSDIFDGQLALAEDSMKGLADALGVVRDSDVLLAYLEDYAGGAPKKDRQSLQRILAAQRRLAGQARRKTLAVAARQDVRKCLREFYETLQRPVNSPAALQSLDKTGDKAIGKYARQIIWRQLEQVTKGRRPVDQLSPLKQHRLRIHIKKLRYLGEFFGELYADGLESIVAPATRMQNLLGTVHDLMVYSELANGLFDALPRSEKKARNRLQASMERQRRSALRKAGRLFRKFASRPTQRQIAARLHKPAGEA